jgi:hypothetical protein
MKHSLTLLKLIVALTLMVGLFSCATSNAKKRGLVTRGCQGYEYHKKHFMN